MKRTLIQLFYTLSVMTVPALAEENQCISTLKSYEENYQFVKEVSDKQRLAYLDSAKELCRDNAVHAIFKSKILVNMAKVDDAFLILDNAIANYSQPIGDVLYEKAELVRRMVGAGYDRKTIHQGVSYEQAISLFMQALKTKTNVKPLIYLGMSEAYISNNQLDKAAENANLGIQLDNKIARFYSLLGIIETKKEDFSKAQYYLELSATRQGSGYLKEPDTVLALAKVLCNAQRKDLVIDLVNKAVEIAASAENIPDLQAAYNIAKHCPHPNPLG
jgi:tetratricopeptide (TPR) repeat protein